MGNPAPTRADDELHLDLLAARLSGEGSITEIAKRRGLTREYVSTVTRRIRIADQKESGEDVTGFYA